MNTSNFRCCENYILGRLNGKKLSTSACRVRSSSWKDSLQTSCPTSPMMPNWDQGLKDEDMTFVEQPIAEVTSLVPRSAVCWSSNHWWKSVPFLHQHKPYQWYISTFKAFFLRSKNSRSRIESVDHIGEHHWIVQGRTWSMVSSRCKWTQ